MSTRPTTKGQPSSRLRLPFGRLRDLPIWSKLGLIMIVPIIVQQIGQLVVEIQKLAEDGIFDDPVGGIQDWLHAARATQPAVHSMRTRASTAPAPRTTQPTLSRFATEPALDADPLQKRGGQQSTKR